MTHFNILVRGSKIPPLFHLCFWMLAKIVIVLIILPVIFSYASFQIPYFLLILPLCPRYLCTARVPFEVLKAHASLLNIMAVTHDTEPDGELL